MTEKFLQSGPFEMSVRFSCQLRFAGLQSNFSPGSAGATNLFLGTHFFKVCELL